jgi:Right handed beta helix region
MIGLRRLAPALAMISLAALAFAQAKAGQPVAVSDAKQLINAIAPGKTIVLRKGDYRLRDAYGVTTKYATWNDGDDGKELSLSKLENLTIRGADGARIVSDSGLSSILGIYDSKNVTLDDIDFVRLPKEGSEVGAGSLYAESVTGLSLDRCTFEGSTTVAVELWECEDVSIKRSEISGATSGALSASYTHDLSVSASRASGCEGYPLIYLEESDKVLFKGTRFEGNTGGNFIEIYAESGSVDSISFEDCDFKGNKVDYFSGSNILPVTDSCRFADSSFGEDWETASVAPASDENYYSDEGTASDDSAASGEASTDEGPQWYEHSSGLSFSYPKQWEMQEFQAQSRVGVFAPDGKSLAFFLTAYKIPAKDIAASSDPAKSKRIFADSAAALAKLLKDQAGIVLAVKADGEPYSDNDLVSADYKGAATKGDGEKAEARVRFVISEAGVDAMVGLAADASSLEADGEIDGIIKSIEATQTDDEGGE